MKSAKLVARLACQKKSYKGILPGPGLAIRIEVTAERLDILRDADLIVRQEINRHGMYNCKPSPSCCPSAVVLWATSTYAYPIVLRLVLDGMTADWARVPYDSVGNYFQPYCQRSSRRQPGGLRYWL